MNIIQEQLVKINIKINIEIQFYDDNNYNDKYIIIIIKMREK